MARKILGYIPESMIIVSAGTGPIVRHWRGRSYDGIDDATPAFPVDARSKKALASARSWAERRVRIDRSDGVVKEDEYNNSPMNLRIVGIEYRRNSLTYKTIDQRNYLFDLREDVVLDAIFNVGIKAGGFLEGEYIWGVLGSQTRIIRVDSNLYEELKEATKLKELKRIGLKALKPNTFYETRSGEIGLFVGFINTEGHVGYNRSIDKVTKAMLWLRVIPHDDRTNSQLVEAYLDRALDKYKYSVSPVIKKSHNFINEIGTLESIPPGAGMIYAIRDMHRHNFRNIIHENIIRSPHYSPSRWDLQRYGALCNMAPYGEEPDIMPECSA